MPRLVEAKLLKFFKQILTIARLDSRPSPFDSTLYIYIYIYIPTTTRRVGSPWGASRLQANAPQTLWSEPAAASERRRFLKEPSKKGKGIPNTRPWRRERGKANQDKGKGRGKARSLQPARSKSFGEHLPAAG